MNLKIIPVLLLLLLAVQKTRPERHRPPYNGSNFVERSLKCPKRLVQGPDNRIIGGQDAASLTWYPSVVHLDDVGCGATILDEGWLITAAHCKVRVGASVMAGNPYKCPYGKFQQRRSVSKVFNHKDYAGKLGKSETGKQEMVNDIALLHVDKPFKWTPAVQPVRLVTPNFEFPDSALATVVGWGMTIPGNRKSLSRRLQEVDVPRIPSTACSKTLAMLRLDYHPGRDCYGFKLGGKDSCSGDSGGPIYGTEAGIPASKSPWKDHILIGIVSFGFGCAQEGVPGIYTSVKYYLGWINETRTKNPYYPKIAEAAATSVRSWSVYVVVLFVCGCVAINIW